MTDKELLELAAKAAGWDSFDWLAGDGYMNVYDAEGHQFVWTPLTDDGDALRLAVKLGLELRMSSEFAIGVIPRYTDNEMFERKNEDPCAATRRAIVRAAAEIGRTL